MKPGKPTDKPWIFVLVALVTLGIIVTHRTEALEVLHTLERGNPFWIFIALFLQGVFFCLQAALFWAAFRMVGVQSRVSHLLLLWFRSIFVSTVAPTLGAAVFIQDAAQRGESPVRAAAGTIVVKVVDMGTLLLMIAVGFVYLGLHHDLTGYELLASLFLGLIVAGWAGVLLMGLWNPTLLRGLLEGLRKAVACVFRLVRRPSLLPEDWATLSTKELSECARLIQTEPRRWLLPTGIALVAHFIDLFSLSALLHAFHATVAPGVLVAGFSVGILFWIVSLTPEGIGTVEGVMGLTFASLGVPLAQATAVALAFRGLAYYLPLVIGVALAHIPYQSAHGVDANASASL